MPSHTTVSPAVSLWYTAMSPFCHGDRCVPTPWPCPPSPWYMLLSLCHHRWSCVPSVPHPHSTHQHPCATTDRVMTPCSPCPHHPVPPHPLCPLDLLCPPCSPVTPCPLCPPCPGDTAASVSPHRVTPQCTDSLPGPTQLRSRGAARRELCGDGGSGPALCRGGHTDTLTFTRGCGCTAWAWRGGGSRAQGEPCPPRRRVTVPTPGAGCGGSGEGAGRRGRYRGRA